MKLYQLWESFDKGAALITETYDRDFFYEQVLSVKQELRLRDDSRLEVEVVYEPNSMTCAAVNAAKYDDEVSSIVVARSIDLKGFTKMKHRLNAGMGLDGSEYRAAYGYSRDDADD